jgi:hypothetical protein
MKEKKHSAKDKSKKDAATNKISPQDGQLGSPLPPALAVNDLYHPSPTLCSGMNTSWADPPKARLSSRVQMR